MTLAASKRGWGTPDRLFGRIVTIRPAGIALQVNEHVAPLFDGFCREIAARGYPLDRVADDWGYAKRKIRRSSTAWSNHAWGLAVDLNATTNPMTSDSRVHTDMPRWVVETAARYGLHWGGNYTGSRRDPMHFEYLGTPAQAAEQIRNLTGDGTAPAARPAHEEDDMTPEQVTQAVQAALEAPQSAFEDKSVIGLLDELNERTKRQGTDLGTLKSAAGSLVTAVAGVQTTVATVQTAVAGVQTAVAELGKKAK